LEAWSSIGDASALGFAQVTIGTVVGANWSVNSRADASLFAQGDRYALLDISYASALGGAWVGVHFTTFGAYWSVFTSADATTVSK